MEIVLTRAALADLKRLPPSAAKRVRTKIGQYAANPEGLANNVKALRGGRSGTLRLRVGEYRVLFFGSDPAMNIVAVGHRSHIYLG